VVSGYAGGHRPDPTYQQVCSGSTGHAEVVQVEFDPQTLSYGDVLDVFWAIHDPTTPNRQGADVGTQYRSIILYHDDEQRKTAESSRDAVQKLWSRPVVTEIVPLEVFYPAEEYHQDYYARNPEQGYCQVVINPKLDKLRTAFASRLRAGV
jgi:peptide-methionine (S)-S-oxide reductase